MRFWRQKGRGCIDLTCHAISERVRRVDVLSYIEAVRADPCGFCGEPGAELDHIDPYNAGGSDAWDNRASLCCSCNNRKQDVPLLPALARHGIRRELGPLAREYTEWTGTPLQLERMGAQARRALRQVA